LQEAKGILLCIVLALTKKSEGLGGYLEEEGRGRRRGRCPQAAPTRWKVHKVSCRTMNPFIGKL